MRFEFPELSPGDEVRISASTYMAFRKCPSQAGARLQGIYGPDSRPGFVGSLAHRIFSRHLNGGQIAPDDFVQACREEIGNSGLNHKMGPLEMRPSDLSAVIEEVRALYDRFTRFPGEGFEGSEQSIEVSPADGVALVGKVDAVYREELGGFRLVDWKTGELGEPEDQLMFYALIWGMDQGAPPAFVEAISVRTGERYRAAPSLPDLEGVRDNLVDMINEVRESWSTGSDLMATGGPWCRYCPLLPDCAEGRSTEALLQGAAPPG